MKTSHRNRIFSLLMLLAISSVIFVSCSKDKDTMDPMPQQKSIVETAASNPDFSILVQALTKAELVSTINSSNNLTVFAPTNSAFQQLFSTLGITGINDLSKETLTPILLYHVLGSKVIAGSVTTGYAATLSNGPETKSYPLYIEKTMNVKINGSTMVTQADLMASNGVIHVIDKVLLPNSVVDIASNNSNFSILVQALVKAELVSTLSGAGPFTVFAPTNAAFTTLFATLGVSGIADLTKDQLTPILLKHVVSGNVLSTELTNGMVPTLNGSIDIMVGTGVVINGNTNVILADVQGTNGVVHAIDKVLLP
ncbi:MAG: fasciclin domain-containing protein [Bacteroidales bacterium]